MKGLGCRNALQLKMFMLYSVVGNFWFMSIYTVYCLFLYISVISGIMEKCPRDLGWGVLRMVDGEEGLAV